MHVGRVCRGWRNIGSEFGIALSHTQELLEFIFSFNSALDSGGCSQRVLDLLSVLIGGKFTWAVFVFESVVLLPSMLVLAVCRCLHETHTGS